MAKALIVQILGDASKFAKSTKDVTDHASLMSSVLQGVGISAGMSMAGLAEEGVGKVVDFMKDAVKGAIDEQKAMAGLTASLVANVAGWDGNTDAIDRATRAAVDKGFADDAAMNSLKVLVAATHDVTEAQKLQNTAMDLARFKGISLEEASQSLVKVEGGQYKMLKSLGIVLEKGATQTEALAAVQKVAGGQADAYLTTLAGKSEVVGAKMGELSDKIGGMLIPALSTAADKVVGLLDAMDPAAPETLFDRLSALGEVARAINPFMWANNVAMDAGRKAEEDMAAAAAQTAMAYDTGSERIGKSLGNMATDSGKTTKEMTSDNKVIQVSYADLAGYLLGDYNSDFGKAMDIGDARAALSADRADIAAARKILASSTSTSKQIADSKTLLTQTEQDSAKQYAALSGLTTLSEADYNAWYLVVSDLYSRAGGAEKEYYRKAMEDIDALRAAAKNEIVQMVTIKTRKKTTGPNGSGYEYLASGGRAKGGLTVVGEEGPELVDLPAGAYVHSNAETMRMASGVPGGASSGGSSGSGTTIVFSGPVYGDGPFLDQLARALAQRLALQGVN